MNAGFETDSWTNQTSLEDYLQKKKWSTIEVHLSGLWAHMFGGYESALLY